MDELTKIAILGTAKHPGAVLSGDHPAGVALAGVATEDREELFLLRSGVEAVYHLAGRQPVGGLDTPVPAAPETCRLPSRKLAGLLQNAVATQANELLIEFLRQMQAGKIVVPFDLLPDLLNCADADVRQHLLPVIGTRGEWLSRQNPDWAWVQRGVAHLGDSGEQEITRVWEEGTIRERCRVVVLLRRSEPDRARDRVAGVFSQEKPPHRVNLLEALETSLSPADEPFLEACLGDRSLAVVQAAARLLCRLPRSALAARMRDRATAMLTAEKKGLLRKKTVLGCAPPEKIERDWERDGIPKQAPSGRGQRAFWAETIVAAVPPSHWQTHFHLKPAELIEALVDDTFAEAVLAGWTEAAARFGTNDPGSAEWLMPLWQHWAGAAGRMQGRGRAGALDRLKTLLPAMSGNQVETGMLRLFETAPTAEGVDVLAMLPLMPRPWTAGFSLKFVAVARRVLKTQADNAAYQWANALFTVARAIPAEVFPKVLAPWDLAGAQRSSDWHVDAVNREIERFAETIQTRQSFIQEVNR